MTPFDQLIFEKAGRVPAVGLGTVKFGRNSDVKYPSSFELPSTQQLSELLRKSYDCGAVVLDTSPAYGRAEHILGELLFGDRERWILGTKAGEEYDDGISTFDFRKSRIIDSVYRSCERLKTDRLDYVLLHSSGDDVAAMGDGGADALFELKQLGIVDHIGISCKTLSGGYKAVENGMDILMLELSVANQAFVGLASYAKTKGVSIIAKKVFGSGWLDTETALKWIGAVDAVSCIMLGTINPDHLGQNIKNYYENL